MQLDIKKALQSPFSDEEWFVKLIFPIIVIILNALGSKYLNLPDLYKQIIFLVAIIPNLILEGFFLQFMHNEIKNQNTLLPVLKVNVFNYLKYGVKSLSFTIYYMILFILSFGLIYIFTEMTLLKFNVQVGIIISCISFFFFLIIYLMAQSAYAENFKLGDAFDFYKLIRLVAKARNHILFFIVYSAIIILLYLFVFYWLAATIIGILLIPLLSTSVGLFLFNLQAQVYKIAKLNYK